MNKLKELWSAAWKDPEYTLVMLIGIWIFGYIILKLLPGWGLWTLLILIPYAAYAGYQAARFPHRVRMKKIYIEYDETMKDLELRVENLIKRQERNALENIFEEGAD